MNERERLFAKCLDDLAAGRLTMDECVARYGGADPELADRLARARALGWVGLAEAGAAKSRVRARLMAALAAGAGESLVDDDAATVPAAPAIQMIPHAAIAPRPAGTGPIAPHGPMAPFQPLAGTRSRPMLAPESAPQAGPPHSGAPHSGAPHRGAPRAARRRLAGRALAGRALAAAAAILAFCGALSWGASTASASALPGDPLYGVKRGQEGLALATAFGDQRRGEVIIAIADHRLAEAQAEADRGNGAAAHNLTAEFATDIQQAITLAATMTNRHENVGPVTAALAQELGRVQRAQNHEARRGNAAFAQTLGTTLANEVAAAQSAHLHLPNVPGSNGNHGHQRGGQPNETPTPGSKGHGHGTSSGGNSSGGAGGGDSGSGDADATPSLGK